MLKRQLRDEDHGLRMQPSLASGESSSTTQLHSENGEYSLMSSHRLAVGIWMVFARMALKPCQMRVLAAIPFQKEHGVSNGSFSHVAPAIGALAANSEGPTRAGERAGWVETQEREESE